MAKKKRTMLDVNPRSSDKVKINKHNKIQKARGDTTPKIRIKKKK